MPTEIQTILVVDDSPLIRRVMRRHLETLGSFTILEAENGAIGVEQFVAHRPQLVFLDLTMPVMGGEEALRLMREADPLARVVVATADVQKGSIERVMAAGAWRLLAKPLKEEHVAEVLRALRESAP